MEGQTQGVGKQKGLRDAAPKYATTYPVGYVGGSLLSVAPYPHQCKVTNNIRFSCHVFLLFSPFGLIYTLSNMPIYTLSK